MKDATLPARLQSPFSSCFNIFTTRILNGLRSSLWGQCDPWLPRHDTAMLKWPSLYPAGLGKQTAVSSLQGKGTLVLLSHGGPARSTQICASYLVGSEPRRPMSGSMAQEGGSNSAATSATLLTSIPGLICPLSHPISSLPICNSRFLGSPQAGSIAWAEVEKKVNRLETKEKNGRKM